MRTRHAAIAAAALLALSACATDIKASPSDSAPAPATQASHPRFGSADLIRPGATKTQAQDAIREQAKTLTGYELYYLKVMHSADATRYVCRARWYADPDAYRAHSGSQDAWPDAWPHLAINCP
jgi:Spy/CpxP family protein refolding chaperone